MAGKLEMLSSFNDIERSRSDQCGETALQKLSQMVRELNSELSKVAANIELTLVKRLTGEDEETFYDVMACYARKPILGVPMWNGSVSISEICVDHKGTMLGAAFTSRLSGGVQIARGCSRAEQDVGDIAMVVAKALFHRFPALEGQIKRRREKIPELAL